MNRRVILIVMDSFGIGEMPDSNDYGDRGANTLKTCSTSSKFCADKLIELGLGNIDGVDCIEKTEKTVGAYARLAESSRGKDTTIGHWEIAGIISKEPLPTFKEGFPNEVIEQIEQLTGRKVLCNKPYSGTEVIRDYGDEHVKTGSLIVYTSADSVLQVAAHEDVIPLEELYDICHKLRSSLLGKYAVGRVIARPFTGTMGNYTRTPNRHDYSLKPTGKTMLDCIKEAGLDCIGVGKINDIFAGQGITDYVYTKGNADGINRTLEYMDTDFRGLLFVNLVDYDMLYGHRRDIDGYADAITYFNNRLDEIKSKMRDEDILMITADHGCDPSYSAHTDHTREYVPLLMYGKNVSAKNYGTRNTFSDIAATILKYLGVEATLDGEAIF